MMNFKFNQFIVDQNVLFVIQTYLGERTEEIFTSLYEIANTITSETLKKTRAARLDKRCEIYYKKSKIPITIDVVSRYYDRHLLENPDSALPITVNIYFKKKMKHYNLDQLKLLSEEKFEKSIGLRECMTALVEVTQPDIKLPKCLKGIL